MKKVTLIALLVLFVGIAAAVTAAWSQEDMTVVDNSDFTDPQRPPSRFNHDEHNEMAAIDDCATCHHVYEDGELVPDESSEDQRCAECHALTRNDDTPALMQAFHTNCKGCHEAEGRGPIMCGECHVR